MLCLSSFCLFVGEMLRSKQFEIEVSYGKICGQIFGEQTAQSIPVIALHGFLDNSNSFRPCAPHITQHGKYYIIAIDLPGMGLSSKIPAGIPYSTKFYLMSLRRVTRHFNLDKFIFLTHSFGCSLALAYSACYAEQVLGLVLLDFAMRECNIDIRDNIGECWRDGIETYLNSEKASKEKPGSSRELTYDFALARLLESNKHIDEISGKILLERGLITVDGKLQYSRDITLVTGLSIRDYHLEFHGIYDCLFKSIGSPICLIYATPPPFGQTLFDQIMKIMNEIKKCSTSVVEFVPIEGTHHFHMLKPEETAKFVLNFLDSHVKIDANNNPKEKEIIHESNNATAITVENK